MLFLRIIQSNLAPSIATGLLPLVMNATEWSFIISVFTFTILLMLGVLVFGLNKGLEKKVTIQYKYMFVFLGLNFVWIGLCLVAGYSQLAVIPPNGGVDLRINAFYVELIQQVFGCRYYHTVRMR
jgi:hypothetical protein